MSLAKVFHKWPVSPRPKVFLWILVGTPETTDIDVPDELTFLVRMSVSKLEGGLEIALKFSLPLSIFAKCHFFFGLYLDRLE